MFKQWKTRKLLIETKIYLTILTKILSLYQQKTKKLVQTIPPEFDWESNFQVEEKTLSNTLIILERRLSGK